MGSFQSTSSRSGTPKGGSRLASSAHLQHGYPSSDRGASDRLTRSYSGHMPQQPSPQFGNNQRPPLHQQPRQNSYRGSNSQGSQRGGGAPPASPLVSSSPHGTYRTANSYSTPQPQRGYPPSSPGLSPYNRSPPLAPIAPQSRSPPVPPRTSSAKGQSPPVRGANGQYPKGTCDKCDGPHLTDGCPIYKKAKEDHPDAWRNFGRKTPLGMGKAGGNFKLKNATVRSQPGDGNCLFHSLAFGLGGTNAAMLRRELANFVQNNPNLDIADTPMSDWVKWDSGCSVKQYAARMSRSGWGGGIEMAACSHQRRVNVHVYEKCRLMGGFKRISCFDAPGGASKTIHVLYRGGVHYDALVPGK